MSMLAEPKRKSKYSTDPRGLNWSNDENKFGQKMLEKMGWNRGKGLGANEDGRADHIDVKHKFDTRGVGCSKSHADNWIAHQDDFNALLSSLNESNPSASNEGCDDKVLSLEEKSKSAKGRVHYMKFTKGKDLSSKSGEDLSCIFGRRKSKSAPATPQTQSEADSSEDSSSERKQLDLICSEEGVSEKAHGIITIKNSLSVSDYFAKKMAEKKACSIQNQNYSPGKEEMTTVPLGFHKSQTAPADLSNISYNSVETYAQVKVNIGEKEKKSKKNKRRQKTDDEIREVGNEVPSVCFLLGNDSDTETPKKKKKRKDKDKIKEKKPDTEVGNNSKNEELGSHEEFNRNKLHEKTKPSKEEKKCNEFHSKQLENKDGVATVDYSQQHSELNSKKKRKKNKAAKEEDPTGDELKHCEIKESSASINASTLIEPESDIKKKKKKKRKRKKGRNSTPERDDYFKINPNVDKKKLNMIKKFKKAEEEAIEAKKQAGFSGSNLGEIEGYGGGINVTKSKFKMKS